ncbi:MAG: tripartite ATP-independent transporter DctM subunit [Motiliproteus sp.]|jgi:tripartite ATP-independent transporter DctM subunit
MELFFLLILILSMVCALSSGFPVAFALPGSAILSIGLAALCGYLFAGDASAYFVEGGPVQWLTAGVTNFRSLYWGVERDTLIAIPLFIFMGIMLQRSKIAEDLLVSMAQLFGPVPGGLGISVVLVGALLAATTGIVGATVIAMGMISLPAMLRNNYSKSLACGTICASGTLGQIIPPSIVLIILADQLSNAADQASTLRKTLYKETTGEFSMPSTLDITSASAGDMFMGALIPGFVLVGLYILYILITAWLKPESAPPVPYEGKYDRHFARKVSLALAPPLILIFVVLGSIILGVATVNQAGSIGAVGALIMGSYRLAEGRKDSYYPAILAISSVLVLAVILAFNDLNIKNIQDADVLPLIAAGIASFTLMVAVMWSVWRTYKIDDTLNGVMKDTVKTTSMVFIILVGAAMLTTAFRGFGGETLVREFLTGLPGGFWGQFFVVMLVIFLLGFFLDFIEIAVVVVPIVAPILLANPEANITAVWLGVMFGLNIQTSFLTPPFGFALFYLRGVAPAVVKTVHIYRGAIMFIGLQLLALVIAGSFPSMVNYLPNRSFLTSETAPPPMNPRLQSCMESYLFEVYADEGDLIRSSIAQMARADLSYLPASVRKTLTSSTEKALATFTLVEEVTAKQRTLDAFNEGYRPLHNLVRGLQAEMRKIDEDLKRLRLLLRRLGNYSEAEPARRAALETEIAELEAERLLLGPQIPANWEVEHAQYVKLEKAAKRTRNRYRNNVDAAYSPVPELLEVLNQTEALAALESDIFGLRAFIASQDSEVAIEQIKTVARTLDSVAGSREVNSKLSKARRALKGSGSDQDEALQHIDEALDILSTQLLWSRLAVTQLLPSLTAYEEAIKSTIGLRQQKRLTVDQAEEVASCLSTHKDISLHF